MKHTALLLTLLASLPLAACSMAPLETDGSGSGSGSGSEQTDSTSDELLWYVSNPAPTVIDFDRTPAQTVITDGTVVDTIYTSLGVTFSCMSCTSGHAFARVPGRSGNGVSVIASPIYPPFDARLGAVRADFATPRSWVSIDVLPIMAEEHLGTPFARPWFEAFDAAGKLVQSVVYYPTYGTTGFGQWQTLRIEDPKGSIKSVVFSSQHGSPQVFGEFDNLTFNTDPYWVEATPVQRPPVLRPILLPAPATPVKP